MQLRQGHNAVLVGVERPRYGLFGVRWIRCCDLDPLQLSSRASDVRFGVGSTHWFSAHVTSSRGGNPRGCGRPVGAPCVVACGGIAILLCLTLRTRMDLLALLAEPRLCSPWICILPMVRAIITHLVGDVQLPASLRGRAAEARA